MPRTFALSIQIENGSIVDIATFGLYLVKSDDIILAPIKDYEKQEYPESAAAEIYPYTTKDRFDYTCTLLGVGAQSTVNASINALWDSLFTVTPGSDLRKALPITLYNYWKGVKVTGYVKTPTPKSHYPVLTDVEKSAYSFDLVLYVVDPRTLLPL